MAMPAREMTFQTAKEQALTLHRSLIPSASPEVRAKITAAARAARTYLSTCGQDCDLHAFLNKDLSRRFSTRKTKELQLLETLIFAETISEMSEQDQLDLQNRLQQQQQIVQMISNIMKLNSDTALSIIRKIG